MREKKTNEAVLREMIEVFWNAVNLDSFGDYFAEGAVLHSGKTTYTGGGAFKTDYAGGFMKAFPDLRHDIEFLIVDGDMAAMRFHGTGILREDYNGLTAAGQKLDYHGTAFFRMVDGLIAEVWSHSDMWQWVEAQ